MILNSIPSLDRINELLEKDNSKENEAKLFLRDRNMNADKEESKENRPKTNFELNSFGFFCLKLEWALLCKVS